MRRIAVSLGCGRLGDDGPVDERVEGEFVPGRVDADGLAGLQGGAAG